MHLYLENMLSNDQVIEVLRPPLMLMLMPYETLTSCGLYCSFIPHREQQLCSVSTGEKIIKTLLQRRPLLLGPPTWSNHSYSFIFIFTHTSLWVLSRPCRAPQCTCVLAGAWFPARLLLLSHWSGELKWIHISLLRVTKRITAPQNSVSVSVSIKLIIWDPTELLDWPFILEIISEYFFRLLHHKEACLAAVSTGTRTGNTQVLANKLRAAEFHLAASLSSGGRITIPHHTQVKVLWAECTWSTQSKSRHVAVKC